MKKFVSIFVIFTLLLSITSCTFLKDKYDYSWADETRFIAHACGAIDGVAMTNSIEALNTNYDNGCRVFEVDLIDTTDGVLVCWHGWSGAKIQSIVPEEYYGRPLDSNEFSQMPIAGQYHTMTFEYLANFMSEHEDVYIITDTKSPDEELIRERFGQIISTASQINPEILDRLIPQIYNEDMLGIINEMYSWKSIIYTLYLIPEGTTYGEIIDFADSNGIRVITCPEYTLYDGFIDELDSLGIYVYLHTFNDIEEVERYSAEGVHGFYTDTLMYSQI